MKNITYFLERVVLSAVFAGFVIPLYLSNSYTISAIDQATGSNLSAHSFPDAAFSEDLAAVGYTWCGCSMIWLFLFVTRKTRKST